MIRKTARICLISDAILGHCAEVSIVVIYAVTHSQMIRRDDIVVSGSWSPEVATSNIRSMAVDKKLGLIFKLHAKDQMSDRRIIMSDVLYVLKNGFVYMDAVPSTQNGYFKYGIECTSPNSEGRSVRLIVIPDLSVCRIKLVTVMWVDEPSTRAGTICEEEI